MNQDLSARVLQSAATVAAKFTSFYESTSMSVNPSIIGDPTGGMYLVVGQSHVPVIVISNFETQTLYFLWEAPYNVPHCASLVLGNYKDDPLALDAAFSSLLVTLAKDAEPPMTV